MKENLPEVTAVAFIVVGLLQLLLSNLLYSMIGDLKQEIKKIKEKQL